MCHIISQMSINACVCNLIQRHGTKYSLGLDVEVRGHCSPNFCSSAALLRGLIHQRAQSHPLQTSREVQQQRHDVTGQPGRCETVSSGELINLWFATVWLDTSCWTLLLCSSQNTQECKMANMTSKKLPIENYKNFIRKLNIQLADKPSVSPLSC